jgi:hypothetical protein
MAAPDLGDFFKAKAKKKTKASNLNTIATAAKPEEKKPKKNDKDEEGWEEEEVKASNVAGIQVVGNLKREEDNKQEEENNAPAWGSVKQSQGQNVNDKRFPTLAKSVKSSSINISDGTDGPVNIKTSKNVFAALDNADSDDEDAAPKRPKEISAAKMQKVKGERESVALQREVDKYVDPSKKDDKQEEKKDKKKDAKPKKKADEDDDDDDDDDEEDSKAKKKKPAKKEAKKEEEDKKEDVEEDLQIVADIEAAIAKYQGRRKLPKKDIPFSEMKEKENKPQQQNRQAGGKKKKFAGWDEEEDKPKLMYLDED